MFSTLPLRYALLTWIVILSVGFTIIEVIYTLHNRENTINQNFQTTVRANGNRLSAEIEQILRTQTNTLAQKQEVKRLFSLYFTGSTTNLYLLNNQGKQIEMSSLEHTALSENYKNLRPEINHVISTGTNQVLLDTDNDMMKGLFAVRMPPKPGQLQHDGYGVVIICVSTAQALHEAYVGAYESIIIRLSLLLVVVISILLFLRKRVILPIASMTKTIQKISLGDNTIRMQIGMDDELAQIARSFNAMLDILAVQNQELEMYKNDLEQQVIQEISKRLEQEKMMMHQSRLAGMGEMIGNIAHQWRQPLNTLSLIIINLETTYAFGELTEEEMSKAVHKATAVIKQMSTTIDDFRNFFTPNKEKAPFSIKESVTNTFYLIEATFVKHNIDVKIDIDPSLQTLGYKNEFSQVILNLFNNSRDVLEERHIENGSILVQGFRDHNEIILRIQDNGGGIPEDILMKIFDPYFSTKPEGKGTGIGLYMSKIIIDEHHEGQLYASNNDDGAVFTIRLTSL